MSRTCGRRCAIDSWKCSRVEAMGQGQVMVRRRQNNAGTMAAVLVREKEILDGIQ
jgi:hypothetical protein